MHPDYWTQFLQDHALAGRSIDIPEDDVASELGASLQIYSEEQSREEAEEFYPGITVHPDGFVPAAQCLEGSRDPYFINTRDGDGGPLYRVCHDAVSDEGCDARDAVAVVLKEFRGLVRCLE